MGRWWWSKAFSFFLSFPSEASSFFAIRDLDDYVEWRWDGYGKDGDGGTVGEMEIREGWRACWKRQASSDGFLAEACLTLLWREATCPCHLSAATYDHDSEVMAGLETSEVYREGPVGVACLS
jgi:hypothetical protein